MNRVLILLLLVLTSGCAAHDYKIDGGRLDLFLDKAAAHEVIFSCSLDGFKPHAASYLDGRWVVSVPSGKPFRYYYLVDGEVYVPPCRMKENDDFGSQNCIFDPHV